MKSIPIIALLISVIALIISVTHKQSAAPSIDEMNRIIDARLLQREQELVARYKPKLQQMERDLGLEPSNATSLEDMAKSLGRVVFMPKP